MTVVGRLAPSPTGHLHLGHARSFLLAWWSARSQGGKVVLRIEDLDVERCRPEYIDDCVRDLEWLGLDWDRGPRLQSAGLEEILAAATKLVQEGFAYPCVCTRGDIKASSNAPQEGESEWRYPGTCRGLYRSRIEAEAISGKPAALRFRVEPGFVEVIDAFAGNQAFDVSTEAGDFPILRRNDSPSYQLSVVVDDARDNVTEVLRGDDLLPSAARQQLLYKALNLPIPQWIHVPLVTDTHGRRLAKRADDLSIRELRERGLDPKVLVNWVATSIGYSFETRPTASEVLSVFQLGKIPRTKVAVSTDDFSAVE